MGGIVESGSKLFKYLSKLGDFRVVCVSKNSDKVRQFITSNDKCYKSVFFHRFAVSKDAIMGLFRDIKSCDVALINGIFTFPVTLAQFYAMVLNRPFIAATRGGLEPWRMAYKKWKKYFYIKLITIPLLKKARYVHVTSKTEATNIRKLGFNNTILITNGIDIDDYRVLPAKYEFRDKFESRFIFLFMSRISREKGIDILISAYRKFCMSIDRSKHLLVLAGPDETQYLGKFITDYEKENIKRYNGVYEKEKIRLIRRADIVILPSYSENFGNIIAEALVCERSVITTTGTPWDEIEKVGCGYYIKPDTEELYKVMKNAYEKDRNELENMGKKGRRYILSNFSWEVKAKELFVYLKELAS